MAIVGSGLGASVGVAPEAVFGTFAPPTRWVEFESENLKWVPKIVQGKAITGTLTPQKAQRVMTSSKIAGDLKTYAFANGLGLFLEQIMGNSAIVQNGTTAAYTQTHTIGDVTGKSLSVQVNRPDTGKGDHPYSYSGIKITDAQFECGVDEIVAATFTAVGKELSVAQALVAPALIANNQVFNFAQGTVLAGNIGSEVEVLSVMKAGVSFKRPLDEGRYPLGGQGLMQEPIQNNFLDITGTLDTEFINVTDWENAFNQQVPLSLILEFVGPVIATGYNSTLKIAVPNIYFSGDGPDVAGPDILKPAYKFAAVDDGVNGLATITYISTDTTI